MPLNLTGPWLVVVTGWTAAGKSTMADRLGAELGATVASFDWVLRRGSSCVLDLVARHEPLHEWRQLAGDYAATLAVVECICSDIDVHRSRVDGRQRQIPGWYELDWDHVERGRQLYEPLPGPKVVIDAVHEPGRRALSV